MTEAPGVPLTYSRQRAHSRLPLPVNAMLGFALAILAVILIAALSFLSLASRASTSAAVTYTLQVNEGLQSLLSTLKDAETGQRGYLLTGEESYLDPYTNAKAQLPTEFARLRIIVGTDTTAQQGVDALERVAKDKMDELESTVVLRREGNTAGALTIVRTDRGKAAMDRFRSQVAQILDAQKNLLTAREAQWQSASQSSVILSWGGSALLLVLIGAAALMTSRDYRARETHAWLRAGQMELSATTQGEQRMEQLGDNVLKFLADYLNAQVGALYIAQEAGDYRRVAGYALAPAHVNSSLRPGDGLLGQAVKQRRALRVRDVPDNYLPVASSLGSAKAREILVAPATIEGVVVAVLELGFFRSLDSEDLELLTRVSETLGIAVQGASDRSRLESLLEETQRQAEELQTQQEELRVSNEELEAQTRALSESHAQLESQQSELEQINTQLASQSERLEEQNQTLVQAQSILTDKTVALERMNQYKSEFLANMSHELRTPLNSSLILAKILADNKPGNLTEEQVKYAQTIFAADNDLLTLINDILDLSKIEAGKVELSPTSVPVGELIEGLVNSLAPITHQKGIKLSAVVDPGTPARIEVDAQRLGQILKNLLSNALKFTDRGEVSLRAYSQTERTISFDVRDTGIGIAKHQQQTIFEAFRQADGSTHRKYGGTGLGLSISKDLAHLLGGDIRVQSTQGEGSVFTLALPVAPVGGESAGTAILAAPQPPTLKLRVPNIVSEDPRPSPPAIEDDRERLTPGTRLILVVEDDTRFAGILRDLAREMGFQCIVTHSANEGLAAAGRYRPSAILLDVNLPDHSGLGVLDLLKHDPQTRHIPVYVASVSDFTREALELGAVGYALKPVKREQLVEAFHRLESKFSQGRRRVLIVEDDRRQRDSISALLANDEVQITGVANASEALQHLKATTYDCMVMDLNLPDLSGYELLDAMAGQEDVSFPPVIVYTGTSLSRDDEQKLRRYSKSIIIKDARSPERLLDEVTLFLHQVESTLPAAHQRLLKAGRDQDKPFQGRRILVVEDDARNIFALSSLLEPRGAKVEIARNGKEAIDVLTRSLGRTENAIDLVLMDLMMPEMDGLTAMREIRKRPEWKKLAIIALTAKAMRDDQEHSLAAGANDYIAKPLDVEKLLSLVRVWLPK